MSCYKRGCNDGRFKQNEPSPGNTITGLHDGYFHNATYVNFSCNTGIPQGGAAPGMYWQAVNIKFNAQFVRQFPFLKALILVYLVTEMLWFHTSCYLQSGFRREMNVK